jgi:AAA family ATP:ADP antiporter
LFKLSPIVEIRRGERVGLAFSVFFAFLSVATVVVGRSLSDAVLLSARPQVDIAQFFIISSVALMGASMVYFALVRVLSPTRLHPMILLLFAVTALYLRFVGEPRSGAMVLLTSTFLTIAPALLNIICWNAISDYFDSSQGRRLFHIVFAASTCGGIAAGLGIPPFIHVFGIESLFYAESFAFCIAIIPALLLSRKHKQERTAITFSSSRDLSLWHNLREGVDDFLRSSLLKTLALIVFFAAIATNVIDFALKDYLREHFSRDEIALFYGHYNAVANAVHLIFQILFVQSILKRYNISMPFLILPIALLLLSVPYLLTASFISIVALKFFDVFLRFTIQDPAREIAVAPIPYFQRNRAKIVIKGFMNPLGAIVAGSLLMATQKWGASISLGMLLLPTLLLWLYSIRHIHKDYASDLMFSLSRGRAEERTPAPLLEQDFDDSLEALQESSPILRQSVLESLPEMLKTQKRNISAVQLQTILKRECRLAAALSLRLAAMDSKSSAKSTRKLNALLDAYDDCIYRIFKILALHFDAHVIDTAYRGLISSQKRTRAQGVELLHSSIYTLEESSLIGILIDDLQHTERSKKLNHYFPELDDAEIEQILRAEGIV